MVTCPPDRVLLVGARSHVLHLQVFIASEDVCYWLIPMLSLLLQVAITQPSLVWMDERSNR